MSYHLFYFRLLDTPDMSAFGNMLRQTWEFVLKDVLRYVYIHCMPHKVLRHAHMRIRYGLVYAAFLKDY